MAMKGEISREFTVWCARCHEWQQEGAKNKTQAIAIFKRFGWKMKDDGWVCINCLK